MLSFAQSRTALKIKVTKYRGCATLRVHGTSASKTAGRAFSVFCFKEGKETSLSFQEEKQAGATYWLKQEIAQFSHEE